MSENDPIVMLRFDPVHNGESAWYDVKAYPFKKKLLQEDVEKIIDEISLPEFVDYAQEFMQCAYCIAASKFNASKENRLNIRTWQKTPGTTLLFHVQCKVLEALHNEELNKALCLENEAGMEMYLDGEFKL